MSYVLNFYLLFY